MTLFRRNSEVGNVASIVKISQCFVELYHWK